MELKNTITEMKNTLEGSNTRLNEAEEWIREVEDRVVKIIATEQKKRMKRNEDSLRDLWNNMKHNNIHIIGIQKDRREKKDPRKYLKRL